MARPGPWKVLAIGLAFVAGGLHLLLGLVNLIPGEETIGPVFLGMGFGYFLVAGFILHGDRLLLQLSALYTVGLILAYVATRLPFDTPLPVEAIGLTTKAVELGLLAALLLPLREPQNPGPEAGVAKVK